MDADDVILPPEQARLRGLTSTLVFPRGNLAPEGSVVKATVSIQNATPPTVSIIATDAVASEVGLDTGMYVISRTGNNSLPLTIKLGIGGTARNGTDCLSLPTQITIPAGASSVSLQLTPNPDSRRERSETVVVTVQSSSVYLVGNAFRATVTISNLPD